LYRSGLYVDDLPQSLRASARNPNGKFSIGRRDTLVSSLKKRPSYRLEQLIEVIKWRQHPCATSPKNDKGIAMTALPLHHGMWVAVCDGRKALLLENKGDATYPKLEMRETFVQDNPPTHEQGTSPPGRSFNSADGARSSMQEEDFHDQAETAFLHKFAACLDGYVRERGVTSLILIAPARALGALRPALSSSTRGVIVRELDRDYVKMPIYEIEKQLLRQL
jgi:protein required for attachment to host cells